jgi:hypothetical protein
MSETTIKTAVINVINTNEDIKKVIKDIVKEFICANDKILTPVVKHVESKIDETFTKIDAHSMVDNVMKKITPCKIKDCLTRCLTDKQKTAGGKHNKTRKKSAKK